MPQDSATLSISELAKYGWCEELRRRAAALDHLDLAYVFERAVTDFRTVKRSSGHQRILHWCIDRGLDFDARAGQGPTAKAHFLALILHSELTAVDRP